MNPSTSVLSDLLKEHGIEASKLVATFRDYLLLPVNEYGGNFFIDEVANDLHVFYRREAIEQVIELIEDERKLNESTCSSKDAEQSSASETSTAEQA
jgi:hypothetical protein